MQAPKFRTQDGLHIFGLLADVEQRARVQCVVQRIVQLARLKNTCQARVRHQPQPSPQVLCHFRWSRRAPTWQQTRQATAI